MNKWQLPRMYILISHNVEHMLALYAVVWRDLQRGFDVPAKFKIPSLFFFCCCSVTASNFPRRICQPWNSSSIPKISLYLPQTFKELDKHRSYNYLCPYGLKGYWKSCKPVKHNVVLRLFGFTANWNKYMMWSSKMSCNFFAIVDFVLQTHLFCSNHCFNALRGYCTSSKSR